MKVTKTKKNVVVPMFSKDDIFKMAEEYSSISEQIKQLESRKKELSDKIKSGAENYGVKDDKGSFYVENDTYVLGKVAKKSITIDNEIAVSFLEKRNMKDLIFTKKFVDEDKLNQRIQEGKISFEEVSSFINSSTSYSVSVKWKENMPEVEVSSIKSASKKK